MKKIAMVLSAILVIALVSGYVWNYKVKPYNGKYAFEVGTELELKPEYKEKDIFWLMAFKPESFGYRKGSMIIEAHSNNGFVQGMNGNAPFMPYDKDMKLKGENAYILEIARSGNLKSMSLTISASKSMIEKFFQVKSQ